MRNHRSGRLRISVLEDQAFAGQAVETGSNSTLGAQKTHAVGASGIERDQDQVGFRGGDCEEAIEKKTQSKQDFSNNNSSNHGIECNSYATRGKVGKGTGCFRLDVQRRAGDNLVTADLAVPSLITPG